MSSPPPAPIPRRRRRRRALLLLLLAVVIVTASWLLQTYLVRREWHRAEAALQRLDLDSAAAHLDRYLEHRPDDTAAWFLAGRTARRRGHFSEAERYLIRCQELGGVTDATRREWDLFRVQQGDLGDVHMRLRMSIPPNHPDAALVLEALARGYLKCDRLRDAVEACDLWTALQPDHPWPWLWRGGVFEQLGNHDQALAEYRRALEVAPQDLGVRRALGGVLVRVRLPGAAVEHFEYVLERSPDDKEALVGLAACRIEEGRSEDAVPLLERVLADDPTSGRALYLRGKAALGLHDAASAERWLTEAVRQAPIDTEAHYLLIIALRAQDKQAEADRLTPRLEALHKDLGRLVELIRTIGRNPDDARPWHEAGVLALRLGQHGEGVRWLLGALRARGDHRPTHAALAEHFRQQGDPRAEYHLRMAQAP